MAKSFVVFVRFLRRHPCSSPRFRLSSRAIFCGWTARCKCVTNRFKMRVRADIAFKEWAVVVDALGRGEQILILRKGGIRERRGEFQVDHASFWLFATQHHEVERSIIPSKRPVLRELAARASTDFADIEFFA